MCLIFRDSIGTDIVEAVAPKKPASPMDFQDVVSSIETHRGIITNRAMSLIRGLSDANLISEVRGYG